MAVCPVSAQQGNAFYQLAEVKMYFKSIYQASCLLPTTFQWATVPFSMRLSKVTLKFSFNPLQSILKAITTKPL